MTIATYNLPSLTRFGYRNSQATRVADTLKPTPLTFLDLNGSANNYDTSSRRRPIINTTRFTGVSDEGDLISATPSVSGYPEDFYILETTAIQSSLGNYLGYFYNDGTSFILPPSTWLSDFFDADSAGKLALAFQGVSYIYYYDDISMNWIEDAVPKLARGFISQFTRQVILPVTKDAPTTPNYIKENHVSRPQLIHSFLEFGLTYFESFIVTGVLTKWAFDTNSYYFLRDSGYDFWSVPVYDEDKNTIIDAKPIPDCRVNHEIILGWDFSIDSSGSAHYARTCVVCWNTPLTIVGPNIEFSEYDQFLMESVPLFSEGTQIRIQWKPIPDWRILSEDNDPDAPQIVHEGWLLDEEIDDTGWTTFAYMTSDADGNIGTNPVTIAGTQPDIGDLVVLRVAYEDTGLSASQIETFTFNSIVTFNWEPTRLPFASRTTDSLIPGWG